jgi:uncharacterized membrane protein
MNSTPIDSLLIFAALFPWACVAVAAWITPRVTRPDLFFAVTVKPSFRASPAGAEILRQYNRWVFIVAVAGLLPLAFIKLSRPLVVLGLLGPVMIELIGYFGAFLLARHRTMPYHVEPTTEREAVLAPRRVSLPGGWLAQAGPFLILAAMTVGLWIHWERIPERIPIHWGIAGKPDGWAAKSPASVFAGVATGVLLCLLMSGISYAVMGNVRRIHSGGRAGSGEGRFVRVVLFFLLAMEYWLALLMGFISLAALRPNVEAPLSELWLILPAETLLIAAIFFIAYRMGQGGWRLAAAGDAGKLNADLPPVGDRTPDECWKLGLFYFNPNDPAAIVEKRFGVGWTLNFANPKSWWLIGVLVFFILATLSLALLMGH